MRRWRPTTLRARLVVVLLACLLGCCAVVAIATSLALRHFLIDRLDQQLVQASNRYVAGLGHASGDHDGDDAVFGGAVGQGAGTLGARVHDGTVTAIAVIGGVEDAGTPDDHTRAVVARLGAGGPRTVRLPRLGEYRVTVVRGADGDLLVTGLPEHPVDETIGRLLTIEALVFALALAAAAVVAAVLVRLSLRPLNRVAATALAVSELPLSSGNVALPDPVEHPSEHTEAGRLARGFNRMLQHVQSGLTERQAAEERLRRFVADASHELRTPVAVVRSHAEFVQRGNAVTDPAAGRALARIVAEADRMGTIVEDLLTLARLDEGRQLSAEPVDLARIALESAEDARAAAPEHHWRLELPDRPVLVRADEHALHQVVANLLANTREHTPPGTTVTVAVQPAAERATLEVRDDGPGIPPELLDRVFERFVRGREATAAGGGAGLGLAIVAALVRAMGGTVQVSSEPGRTCVRVELSTAP